MNYKKLFSLFIEQYMYNTIHCTIHVQYNVQYNTLYNRCTWRKGRNDGSYMYINR